MLPPAKVSGTTLEKTVIAEGSIINASRMEKCVIGIRSRIGHGSTVVNTYIMGSDYYETLTDIAIRSMQKAFHYWVSATGVISKMRSLIKIAALAMMSASMAALTLKIQIILFILSKME